jgi:hypothetical protein
LIFLTLLKPVGCSMEVRVVGRRRGHREHGAGLRIEDDTAPPSGELVQGESWMSGRSVRITSSPRMVLPPSLSSVCLSVLLRFVFAPVR